MSLAKLLKKGSLLGLATAIPATFATVAPLTLPKVARVATVAVANAQKPTAKDPAQTTDTVANIGTVRPPGFSPALLAASRALDAQIEAAGLEAPDSDRWCWPSGTAMTGAEIDSFTARLSRFTDKGLTTDDGEALADKLVARDRESDDRRMCLECTHLAGYGATSWRCGNWQAAKVAHRAQDSKLPGDLVRKLQRCDGFTESATSKTFS